MKLPKKKEIYIYIYIYIYICKKKHVAKQNSTLRKLDLGKRELNGKIMSDSHVSWR